MTTSVPARRDRRGPEVRVAKEADFESFLRLAAEVEHWFGPMVQDPGFHTSVRRNIERGSALVAVNDDDDDEVVGGLLFSHHRRPDYDIGWLVVAEAARSRGIGETLLAQAFRWWVDIPATVTVVTFGADHPAARSRRFYERLGFRPAEVVQDGPEGGSRQRFRLEVDDALPRWAGLNQERDNEP